MELHITEWIPKPGGRVQKCSNAYCVTTPAWSVDYTSKETSHLDYVCNNHLIDFVTSMINNMRIRKQ